MWGLTQGHVTGHNYPRILECSYGLETLYGLNIFESFLAKFAMKKAAYVLGLSLSSDNNHVIYIFHYLINGKCE